MRRIRSSAAAFTLIMAAVLVAPSFAEANVFGTKGRTVPIIPILVLLITGVVSGVLYAILRQRFHAAAHEQTDHAFEVRELTRGQLFMRNNAHAAAGEPLEVVPPELMADLDRLDNHYVVIEQDFFNALQGLLNWLALSWGLACISLGAFLTYRLVGA